MARRVPGELVALALLLAPAAPAAGPHARPEREPDFAVLAAHGFEEGTDATGPDTFRVFSEARGRVVEAAEGLAQDAADWGDDPRFAVASAMVAAARGDWDEALAWTRGPAERLATSNPASDRPDREALVPPEARRSLEASLLADEHYHLLAAAGRLAEAAAFSARMQSLPGAPAAQWLEREADVRLLGGDADAAQPAYRRALAAAGADASSSLLLKLADACFLLGDLPGEKALRERIYGTLDPRP